jgi:hypothetical protein
MSVFSRLYSAISKVSVPFNFFVIIIIIIIIIVTIIILLYKRPKYFAVVEPQKPTSANITK